MAKRKPGETWRCWSCGKALIGARTIAGKVAPIEVDVTENANCFLFRGAGGEVRVAVLGGPLLDEAKRQGFQLRLNHFASCPDRERWRSDDKRVDEAERQDSSVRSDP